MKPRNYDEKMKLDTWSKRTQTKPKYFPHSSLSKSPVVYPRGPILLLALVNFLSLLAICEVSLPPTSRHCQLPLIVAGRFIRASSPNPKISCIGIITVFDTEPNASFINAQLIRLRQGFGGQVRPAKRQSNNLFFCSASASLLNQPFMVLLSCVPVYKTEFLMRLRGL